MNPIAPARPAFTALVPAAVWQAGAALLALAGLAAPVQAADRTYDFKGFTHVGGSSHAFTGVFVLDTAAVGRTVYTPGDRGPVQQGFTTRYAGAVEQLSIRLDNGETVTALPGELQLNNIQQAEPGSQVPAGLSAQAWTGGASGTINGLSVFNLYLAFLPVSADGFSWDGLDGYFGDNAEQLLQEDPSRLPAGIDPRLTGTALPGDLLSVYSGGLFLGTNHGLTNTVNTITDITLRAPVPEPASAWMLATGGLALLGLRRRRRG